MNFLKITTYQLISVALLLLLAFKGFAQQPEKFKYRPYVINQGQNVNIVYRPEDPAAKVTGSVYLYKNYKWEGHDIPLTKTDTGYISSYTVPEGTALISYRFWVGDTVDAGIKFPYGLMIHTPDGKAMTPGAYTQWGLYRTKAYDGQMLPFVSPQSEITPRVLVQLWISREYGNIGVRRHMFFDMARGIKSALPQPQADSIIRAGGQEILGLPDVSEREMVTVERTYRMVLYNRQTADSIKSIILAKYPNGLRKRMGYIDTLYLNQKLAEKPAMLKAFLAKYPLSEFPYDDYLNPAIGDPGPFINGFTGTINVLFMNKQFAQLKEFIKVAPYRMLGYYYDHYVDYPMRPSKAMITEAQQLDMSTFITSVILERAEMKAALSGRGYIPESEWKRTVISNYKQQINYHANLLYKAGNYTGAKKYALMIMPYMGIDNISFNALYTNLLERDHAAAQSEQYITEAVKADTASPEMVALLKNYYMKKHGGIAGFDSYYASLIPPAKVAAFQEKLKKSMINLPAPMFSIKNMQGQNVDLATKKGKTIILDFWASWCYPCKAAMPGMETLVKKYKSDPNVEFYFISTLEESANYKQLVQNFIKEKKYDFNVLYDDQNASGGHSGVVFESYAKLLHLSGIPQKVVIDPQGNVRWVSDGFNGDLINLTREVDYIISVIKNAKAE